MSPTSACRDGCSATTAWTDTTHIVDAFAFLDKAAKATPQPVYAVVGDEAFLKREVMAALQCRLLGDADPAFAWTAFPGEEANWSNVRSELGTLPFLSEIRVVAIEAADKFVTDNRTTLEKYVAQPARTGVLILEVKTWPANTKLAKLLPDPATIVCKAGKQDVVARWCTKRAQAIHKKSLPADAAAWLLELVGLDMGLLDQELAKLATFAGTAATITIDDITKLVGRSREAETFKMFDAIGENRPAEALNILHRLYNEGAEPIAILGAFSWMLRQLSTVGRGVIQGQSLAMSMERAKVPPFARHGVEKQLRHLGQRRIAKLYDWLVEADLAMKSSGDLPREVILERLLIRLARPREN